LKIDVRRGDADEGRRIPIVTSETNRAGSFTAAAAKNPHAEIARRRESVFGAENPRLREIKSRSGLSRRPLVPADDMIDLSMAVPWK
jgi:hypothetical protein